MLRIIAHLDMDAFFASVEGRENPQFRGKPLAVGADPKEGKGRGVVSTANYLARKYGIHSATPISVAWRLSEKAKAQGLPPVIFLPVNMGHYADISEKIMTLLRKEVELVEEASIDEAYLDLSFLGTFKKAEDWARRVKEQIKSEERLTASVGIGPNKLIAKMASGKNKPDGLTIIKTKEVKDFLSPLSIREIPGIGPKTEILLNSKNIKVISDLQKMSEEELGEMLGKWGRDLYYKAQGISDAPVTEDHEVKSIGEQETYEEDTLDSMIIMESINAMATRIIKSMQDSEFKSFRTVTITIRFSDFQTKTRSRTIDFLGKDPVTLKREALKLFLPFLDKRENPQKKLIRLIGLRIEKLY
ncbi:MAG: DNA polymerase IV [bacterium]|nr:DNA polymerase IV [bacterium]